MPLSEKKRIEILMMVGYGDRKRSHITVADLFNNVHPDENISRSTVSKIVRKFETTGTVKNVPRGGRPKSATNINKALDVVLSTLDEPNSSSTQLALDNQVSQSSVIRILKEAKLKPYKVKLLHELNEDDPDRRLQFCEIMMERASNDNQFINNILFSDEATFCLNGTVNRQNCRYWSFENPCWTQTARTQYPQKVNVWAGIIGDKLIGPFFIDGTLTGDRYLNLLRNDVIPSLVRLHPGENDNVHNTIWFQQDGAPPHYAGQVRNYLNDTFRNRWIGRRGTIEWPARSPDLTPLDFFLWGHVKNMVYVDRPNNLEDLKIRIRRVMSEIPQEHLLNSVQGVIHRLSYCQETNGLQFEHLIH